MRAAPLIFLLLIPAFIAIGHDIYLFYTNFLNPGRFSIDLLLKEFKFSALGFIWTTYDVESYKMAFETMEPKDWAMLDFFLTLKAFFVGLAFTSTFIVLFIILKLFGKGPFAAEQENTSKIIKKGSSKKAGFSSKK
jgi:hypothetical protein